MLSGILIRIFATHENSKSAIEMPVLLTVEIEKEIDNIICFKYIPACREAECIWKVATGISPCCFLGYVYVALTQFQDEAQKDLMT